MNTRAEERHVESADLLGITDTGLFEVASRLRGYVTIRQFERADEDNVVHLWERCGLLRAWNDPHRDIARKMSEQPELFLVGQLDDEVIATAMAGFDGHRGWVYYLAVAPEHRQNAYGRRIMEEIERMLMERGCPKVNLLVRSSNREVLEFYRRLGYAEDDVVSLGKRLIAD